MSIVLRKDDFRDASIWEWLLETVGIETHVMVAGRVIDTEIEEINFTPVLCKYFQEAVELGLQGKKAEEYALQKMEERGDDPYE